MGLRINDIAPDFTADSTEGPLHFHEWIGSGYAIYLWDGSGAKLLGELSRFEDDAFSGAV